MGTIEKEDNNFIFDQCSSLLPKLIGKKIFLTGGTGFFGKNLLKAFGYFNSQIDSPIRVTVLSRNPEEFLRNFDGIKNKNFNFIEGNISNPIKIDNDFDFIINAAVPSTTELINLDSDLNYKIITEGTKNIIDFANTNKVSKVLFTSSGAVYGRMPKSKNFFSEEDFSGKDSNLQANSNNAQSVYGRGKLDAEKLHYNELKNKFSIARCFTLAGPYLPLDQNFALGNFINDMLRQRDIRLNSDGSSIRSYMYTADLIIWLLTIMVKGRDREAYNVGSDQPISIKNLAYKVLENTKSDDKLKLIISDHQSNNNLSRYLPSIKKSQNELNLKLNYDLNKIIKKTWGWYLLRNRYEV